MKPLKNLFKLGALCAVFSFSACVSPYAGPNESNGAVIGGLTGAGAGAIIGHRHPLEGAAIGGVLGSVAGSAIGRSQDEYYYGY